MFPTPEMRMCDVCRLVDYDTTLKLCGYCSLCDAWICKDCNTNWPKRIKAAIRRRLEPGYNGQPDYVERIEDERKRADNNISTTSL